jgi:dienelactone hydrolase
VQVQRDYSKEKPASDEMFRAYRSLYSYDRGPLDTKVEQVDEDDPSWRKEKITFNAAYGNERMLLYLYLPRNATPPYQAVIHFPGSYARFWPTPENISLFYVRFFVQSGRALVFPIYQGFYERRPKIRNMGQHAIRDEKIQWSKDLGRSIDYLETRQDIDLARLAYHGVSLGAWAALPLLAMEERLKTAVLLAGGLPPFSALLPEEDPINFVPRVRIPVLMINGRDDFVNTVEGSQLPLFRFLGSPPADKRHVMVDGGHVVPRNVMIKESLDWLDQYLGPVQGRP